MSNNSDAPLPPVLGTITAGFLFLGIADLPIGYYTFLRIVVTIASVGFIYWSYESGINLLLVLFGITGFLFNPIIPVYLHDKEAWMVIDGIAGLFFLISGFILKNQ